MECVHEGLYRVGHDFADFTLWNFHNLGEIALFVAALAEDDDEVIALHVVWDRVVLLFVVLHIVHVSEDCWQRDQYAGTQ